MQFELVYPVLFRTNDRPAEGNTYFEAYVAQTVDIPEFSDDELPVAIRFKRQYDKQPDVYRYHDASDQLYSPSSRTFVLKPAAELLKIDNLAHEREYPTHRLFHAVKTRRDAVRKAGATITRERGVGALAPKDANPKDLAAARAEFEALVGGFVVMGKRLYMKTTEPVLELYRTSVGWKVELSHITRPWRQSRLHFVFSLDRFEEMKKLQQTLSELTGNPVTVDELEMDAYRSVVDAYALDVEFCVIDFNARVEESLAQGVVQRSERLGLGELPDEVVDTYLRGRRFLALPRESRDEDMIGEMMQAVATACEYQKVHRFRNFLPKASEIAFHVEKWNLRPISFSADLGGPTP